MASYQSFEKCLQCGGVMIMDFDTRTENLYGCCPRCGRHANVFRREDDGKDHPLEIDDHFGYILSLPDNDDRFNTQHNRLGLGHRDLMEHLCDKDRQYYYDHVLVPMPGVTLKNFISEVRR